MAFKRTKILDFFSSFAAPPPQLYIEILVRKFQRYIYLPKYILDDQLKKFFNSFSPIIHFNLPITKRFLICLWNVQIQIVIKSAQMNQLG